mmetsp:Transcript_7190/g.16313  ORF Transcript_7190/g.16313 Transcript_7190/m.16313 type:complete len:101 (+) Transcript_7190:433-735(+)
MGLLSKVPCWNFPTTPSSFALLAGAVGRSLSVDTELATSRNWEPEDPEDPEEPELSVFTPASLVARKDKQGQDNVWRKHCSDWERSTGSKSKKVFFTVMS